MEGSIAGFRPWFIKPVDLSGPEGEIRREALLRIITTDIRQWATQNGRIIIVVEKYKCVIEDHPTIGNVVKVFDIIRTDGVQDRVRFWYNRDSVLFIKDLLTPEKRHPDFDQLLVM